MADTYRPAPPSNYDDRRNDRYHDRDDYRAQDRYDTYRPRSYSRSPPRHPADMAPRNSKSRPARGGDGMYRFGDNSIRNHDANGSNGHKSQGDFSFRSDRQAEFHNGNSNHQAPRGPKAGRNNNRNNQGNRNRQNGYQQRRFVPKPANARDILHSNVEREGTPERLTGMVEGQSKFKDVDFIDDDDWDDDSIEGTNNSADGPSEKRAKISNGSEEVENKPKWSNPDPYTVLPPVADTNIKKKDVLQLIRKAKVEDEKAANQANNAVTRNADFISFGDDDDDEPSWDAPHDEGASGPIESSADKQANNDTKTHLHGSMNDVSASFMPTTAAPSESFSHLKHLHPTVGSASQDAEEEEEEDLFDNSEESYTPIPATNGRITPVKDMPRSRRGRPAAPHGQKRGRDGEIQMQWIAHDRASSTPWYIDHSATPNMSFWLHKEICDFYDFIKPRAFEQKIRHDLIQRVQTALLRTPYFNGCRLHAFGSYGQGIYLPTSDMDLVLLSPMYQHQGSVGYGKNTLHRISQALYQERIAAPDSVNLIKFAKVPIAKFVDRETGLHVDISMDNVGGLQALTTFDGWRRNWPWLPALLSVLKQFLLMRDINEVYNGGLGGFSITCMLVSMLQMSPRFQTGNFDAGGSLGETLLEFFDLYGNKFNMNSTGIRVNPPRYFSKVNSGGKPDRWTIMDPNRSDNDLSGGSSEAYMISQKFSQAHRALIDTMATLSSAGPMLRKGQSILRLIIGGNYEQVVAQRNILRQIHVRRFGKIAPGDD